MKAKRRKTVKWIKDAQERGVDVSKTHIEDDDLYTGTHTYVVSLNEKVPEELDVLKHILSLPPRRRGPELRRLAILAFKSSGGVQASLPYQQSGGVNFSMPTPAAESKRSALGSLEDF